MLPSLFLTNTGSNPSVAESTTRSDGTPNTAHTLNLVPFFIIDKDWKGTVSPGKLGDLAPTILTTMMVTMSVIIHVTTIIIIIALSQLLVMPTVLITAHQILFQRLSHQNTEIAGITVIQGISMEILQKFTSAVFTIFVLL